MNEQRAGQLLDEPDAGQPAPQPQATPGSGLRVVLIALVAAASLVGAGAAGWLAGHRVASDSVSDGSVDAGFARDMSTHHQQAITMASFERDHTRSPTLKLVSYEIAGSQAFELGEMQGWVDSWGLTRSSNRPPLQWTGGQLRRTDASVIPGMATAIQVNLLQSLHGKALDIEFLQLMIHQYQGGMVMERYAIAYAKRPYVRNLARAMMTVQIAEIVQMQKTLKQLGGVPLPPLDH